MSTLSNVSQANRGWVYHDEPPYPPFIPFRYLLTGPSSGGGGVPSTNFTVSLPNGKSVPGPVTITPNDGGGGGTFTPSSVILTTAAPSATFKYTPDIGGSPLGGMKSIKVTNDGGLLDPDQISYTVVSSTYLLTGPGAGTPGTPSDNFTASLPVGGAVVGTLVVTPNDSGAGGTFTPATVSLTTAAPSATFTYTAAHNGTKTISVTNNQALVNPTPLSFIASGGPMSDGDPVDLWPDSSGNAHNGSQTGSKRPIYKTNIQNGLPVVRFTSAGLSGLDLVGSISAAEPICIFAVCKPAAIHNLLYTLSSSGAAASTPLGITHSPSGLPNYLLVESGATVGYFTPNGFDTAFHLYRGDVAGGTAGLFVDGVGQATTVGAAAGTGSFDRIGYRPFDSTYSNGDIGEILIYNNIPNGTDLNSIRTYLLNKWFGTATAFDPRTVTGLKGWWKADVLASPLYSLIDTTVSGDAVRLMVPASRKTGTALVYCHGLGGSQLDIGSNSLNMVYTIPAVNAGYLVAACNAIGYNWDNPTAQAAVEALVAYLHSTYAVTDVVMIGGSAGGPVSMLKATQNNFPSVTVRGWHSIFPVFDLDAAHSNPALTASIDAAFPGYPGSAAGRDPALFPNTAFNGLRILCCQSPADTVTPKALHGDVLVAHATGHATEVTCTATTGDHGDPSNFTPALAADFIAFLGRCFP
jgi:hypothetical protein